MIKILMRKMKFSDITLIVDSFALQGWDKPRKLYEDYLIMQSSGERDIIIAEFEGDFAGYLTIAWKSSYLPFAKNKIPEIVDFNVLIKYRRRKIGTALMDKAEKRIKEVSSKAGIGFGLYRDYGAAQVLYINRGYIPDGQGIVQNNQPIDPGKVIAVDDSIVMYLIKDLTT